MNNLKPLSHSDHAIAYKVSIHDVDITEYVKSVGSIRKKSDFPDLHRFRVDDANITLSDHEGYFSPTNPTSFFIQNNLNADGFGTTIKIEAGFTVDGIDTLNVMFEGKILDIDQSSEGDILILAVDKSHDMFRDRIKDFGIERTFKLVSGEGDDFHGFYPLPDFLLDISEESDSILKAAGQSLTRVDKINEAGAFDADNYEIVSDGIKTEGGLPENVAEGYPRITFKSPFKGSKITKLIDALLDHADITNKEVILPSPDLGEHFMDTGRPGYEFVGTDPLDAQVPPSWQGHVTDMLWENDVFYYLYNATLVDNLNRSRLVSYTEATDTWNILFQAARQVGDGSSQSGVEFWKMAKRGNRFGILSTSSDARVIDTDIVSTITTVVLDISRVHRIVFGRADKFETGQFAIIKIVFNVPVASVKLKESFEFKGVEIDFNGTKIYRSRNRTDEPSVPNSVNFDDPNHDDFEDITLNWIEESKDIINTPTRTFFIKLFIVKRIEDDDLTTEDESRFVIEVKDNGVRNAIVDNILPDLRDLVPEDGAYEAIRAGTNRVFIQEVNINTQSSRTLVPTNSVNRPILASFYQLGESGLTTVVGNLVPFSSFPNLLPDTRRNLIYNGNRLLYCYFNFSAGQFGIASVSRSGSINIIRTFDREGVNFAGVNFILEGNTLWSMITDKESSSSEVLLYQDTV